MKFINKILPIILAVLLPVGFVGCSDDDDTLPAPPSQEIPGFVLENESIRVKIGTENKTTINVKEGGGDYGAFVLDESIATAEVENGIVKIEGLKNGVTSLIISDKYSRYRKIPVSVYTTEKLQLSDDNLNLVTRLGSSGKLTASVVLGNGGYEIISDNESVTPAINEDGEITLTAISKKADFIAEITVTDCTNLVATINVTVKASLVPFTDEELDEITSNDSKRYSYNGSKVDSSYYTYFNDITSEGKNRYGWDYYNFYWYYVIFAGDKNVGIKADATFQYKYSGININIPVNFEIIKNDGTNIWGIFHYIDEGAEKLNSGYFCDKFRK